MRKPIAALAIVLLVQGGLFGQYRTKGLALSVRVNGASWKLDAVEGTAFHAHQGGGAGAGVYFGMSQFFGLFGQIDLSSMSPDEGRSYTLTHFDVGARVMPLFAFKRVRPYAELAFSARSAEFDVGFQALQASGPGATVGAGCLVFLGPGFALNLGADGTFGSMENLTLGGFDVDTNVAAKSWRAGASVVWFP